MRLAESLDGVPQGQTATPIFFWVAEIQHRSTEWCYSSVLAHYCAAAGVIVAIAAS